VPVVHDRAKRVQSFEFNRYTLAPRPGQVGEQHIRGRGIARLEDGAQPLQPRIRHLEGAEVHLRLRPPLQARERIEQRGLSRSGKSRETRAHEGLRLRGTRTHFVNLYSPTTYTPSDYASST